MSWHTCRRLTTSTLFVMVMVMAFHATNVLGRPCPKNSMFLYSKRLQESICACHTGYSCVNDGCIQGSANEVPGFREGVTGFPTNCTRCFCFDRNNPGADLAIHGTGKNLGTITHPIYDHPDPIFDAKCIIDPAVTPPKPVALETMNWVHIPKCGTSLTTLIYNYACRDFQGQRNTTFTKVSTEAPLSSWFSKYTDSTCDLCYKVCAGSHKKCKVFTQWAPHTGLVSDGRSFVEKDCAARTIGVIPGHTPLVFENSFKNTYVGTFRDPRRRVLSAFNYHRHAYKMPKPDQMKLKSTKTLEEFLAADGIPHCQTKHLNGIDCGAMHKKMTFKKLIRAIRRLDSFAFVGLTDRYLETVCLFHKMFGGAAHPHEFENLRDGTDFLAQYEAEGYVILPKDAWERMDVREDPLDWLLYVVVENTFYERLKKYGVATSDKVHAEHAAIVEHCSDWLQEDFLEDEAFNEEHVKAPPSAMDCLEYQHSTFVQMYERRTGSS
eukprot:m.288460 g.288460  ORF g.288460 m.288460 type:complete len:493 (+) comp15803_c1_seq3:182-1660(+)